MYDYVRRAYGVAPQPGQRVVTNASGFGHVRQYGTVQPEDESMAHYVMVTFDPPKPAAGGVRRDPAPCHPTSIDYL